jgi:hypothetical protein
VGLSREQIACFNWEADKQLPLLRGLIDRRVGETQRLREQIQGLAPSDDFVGKDRLWNEATEALVDVRLIGDLLVSSFFQREKSKERQTLRSAYAGKVQDYLSGGNASELTSIAVALRDGPRPIPPFHWEVEFPEVFTRRNDGFDVFVGNPPFSGKNTLASSSRPSYPAWIQTLHEESHGNADLVAHFYRRAFDLLRNGGTFGLIATNTIAQGDTRSTGLRWICLHSGTIFAARKRVKWPGQAAVVVSVVHVGKGPVTGPYDLDGSTVDRITAFLLHTGGDTDPARLAANTGLAFKGVSPNGRGFVFSDADTEATPVAIMQSLISMQPGCSERIRPFIGGEEILSRPDLRPDRWIIDLDGLTEVEAGRWPHLMQILEERVKPEREAKGGDVATIPFWHFERARPALRQAIHGLELVLICPMISNKLCFVFLPAQMVFSHKLAVFAFEGLLAFSVLQSRIHEGWARVFTSTFKDDLNYSLSDCFETFPFPTSWKNNASLASTGREYYEFRAALMIRNNQGLTKTYNRFHNPDELGPDIVKLRELHDAMDRAVLDAYSWTDILPRCEFILDYDDDDDDETPGKAIQPSFLIEVMALDILKPSWGGDYRREMQAFFATLADRIHETWPDPAGLGPPVSDNMDAQTIQSAREKLRAAERQAADAMRLERDGKLGDALRAWRALFGPLFPLS